MITTTDCDSVYSICSDAQSLCMDQQHSPSVGIRSVMLSLVMFLGLKCRQNN